VNLFSSMTATPSGRTLRLVRAGADAVKARVKIGAFTRRLRVKNTKVEAARIISLQSDVSDDLYAPSPSSLNGRFTTDKYSPASAASLSQSASMEGAENFQKLLGAYTNAQ
jgi:hypothetical protein